MLRRTIAIGLVMSLGLVACGDDDSAGTTAADTTTSEATTTSVTHPTTTTSVTTTSTAAPTSSTAPPTTAAAPSARDSLTDFIAAAENLDQAIAAAATSFNESWEATGTVSPQAEAAIDALDTTPLRRLVPPGLTPDLEVAVLAVFADLDSRASALAGAVRFHEWAPEDVMICLDYGAVSFRRFDDDFARMLDLALVSPVPTAAPDSTEAGILAVRMEAIHSRDWGCDSCGGVQYDQPFPVDWEGRTILGVEFEATFDGTEWQILIYAC